MRERSAEGKRLQMYFTSTKEKKMLELRATAIRYL